MKKYFKIVSFGFLLFLCCGMIPRADDKFMTAQKISGRYFNVFYESGVDVRELFKGLDVNPSDMLLAGRTKEAGLLPGEELAEMLDVLFVRVCEILDMRLYSFKGTIKVCYNSEELNRIYDDLFGSDGKTRKSFYNYDFNIIYVSAENFSRDIVTHEIAHAVISHYFVISPSAKVQELLAGYAEYQLRSIPEEK
ncbi:MAG: hypothetical protein PHQ57_02595 [Candidatus Omnitrophica bacterium]|nr:hypothetical protein [Candidatus Omnitrophota bacterium]